VLVRGVDASLIVKMGDEAEAGVGFLAGVRSRGTRAGVTSREFLTSKPGHCSSVGLENNVV
jgi:hypothetical protein